MLKELFIHVCIVMTFLFSGGIIFKRYPYIDTITQKILFGLLSGVLGSLLMFFSIKLAPEVILDFRYMAILIAAIYGGGISAMVSAIIICFNRILFIEGTFETLIIIVSTYLMIAGFSAFISNLRITLLKKWTYMVLFSMSILTCLYLLLLGTANHTISILLTYLGISIVLGILVFIFANFIDQMNKAYLEMTHLSNTDFLTGLNNVRQFDFLFNSKLEQAKRKSEKLSLLMIDIDYFKKVNDTYGHAAGDDILKQLGELLIKTMLRPIDIVSRNGGEEFTVLLPRCNHILALNIAEKIRLAVEKNTFTLTDGTKIMVTISIGVATYLETVDTPELLLKQADVALYEAKRTGRNKVCSSSERIKNAQ